MSMEEEKKLMVCIVCLSTRCDLYSLTSLSLAATYTQLSQAPRDARAPLPLVACAACVARVRGARRLAEQCRRAYRLLMDVYECNLQITLEDINRINQDETPKLLATYLSPNHCDLHIRVEEDADTELEGAACPDEPLVEYDACKEEGGLSHEGRFDSDDLATLQTPDKRIAQQPQHENESNYHEDTNKAHTKRKHAKKSKVKLKSELKNFRVQKLSLQEQIVELQKGKLRFKYAESPFKCDRCFKGFSTEDTFNAHKAKHDESTGRHACPVCHIRFASRAALHHHTAGHNTLYTCTECSYETKYRTVASAHTQWHGGAVYRCDQCTEDVTFTRQTSLLSHKRIHHASAHCCALCGYSFVGEKGLLQHQKLKHSKEQLPTEGPRCAECDVMFTNEDVLHIHRKIQHERCKLNDSNYNKQVSSVRRPATSDASRTHARRGKGVDFVRNIKTTNQDGGGSEFTCDDCAESFASAQLYRAHCRAAHGRSAAAAADNRPLRAQCHVCGRLFSCQSKLRAHMEVHDSSTSHPCPDCGKRYKSGLLLKMHRRQSHNARYACPLCQKTFSVRFNRDRHYTYVHTTVKDVQCSYCPKKFKSVAEQRLHHQHLHLLKPWPKRARRKARGET